MINWLQGPGGYSADVQVIRETHLAADRYWFDSALEMLILNFLVWSEKHVVCSDVDWNEHPQFNATMIPTNNCCRFTNIIHTICIWLTLGEIFTHRAIQYFWVSAVPSWIINRSLREQRSLITVVTSKSDTQPYCWWNINEPGVISPHSPAHTGLFPKAFITQMRASTLWISKGLTRFCQY